MEKEFEYDWSLKDINSYRPRNGLKVFSTFSCGGGSSMGYKLAGYEVLGGLEINQQAAKAYQKNLNPQYMFNQDIRDFKNRTDLPEQLYNLDILDGSPPCSPFSFQGKRHRQWGIEKSYSEGSGKQILDDLFFHFIDVVEKLKPKVVVAENVKGLTLGKAQIYYHAIEEKFNKIGYKVKSSLLNTKYFNVPQARERIIFIATRKDVNTDNLIFSNTLSKTISFNQISDDLDRTAIACLIKNKAELLCEGQAIGSYMSRKRIYLSSPVPTLTTKIQFIHPKYSRYINLSEKIKASTFPRDYDFLDCKPDLILGMSVPPLFMANIADKIYKSIFKNSYRN